MLYFIPQIVAIAIAIGVRPVKSILAFLMKEEAWERVEDSCSGFQ